jgi:hypothetical protein
VLAERIASRDHAGAAGEISQPSWNNPAALHVLENEAPNMGSARQALPVQAMVMTSPTGSSELRHHAPVYRVALRVIESPADAEECGDGGETEHPPQNPDHFRGKG